MAFQPHRIDKLAAQTTPSEGELRIPILFPCTFGSRSSSPPQAEEDG
jgi:hypothetical protein